MLQSIRNNVKLLNGTLVIVEIQSNYDSGCNDGQTPIGYPMATKASVDSNTVTGSSIPKTLTGEKGVSAISIAKAEYKL